MTSTKLMCNALSYTCTHIHMYTKCRNEYLFSVPQTHKTKNDWAKIILNIWNYNNSCVVCSNGKVIVQNTMRHRGLWIKYWRKEGRMKVKGSKVDNYVYFIVFPRTTLQGWGTTGIIFKSLPPFNYVGFSDCRTIIQTRISHFKVTLKSSFVFFYMWR